MVERRVVFVFLLFLVGLLGFANAESLDAFSLNYSGIDFAPPYDIFELNKSFFSLSFDNVVNNSGHVGVDVALSGGVIYNQGYYWDNSSLNWTSFSFNQSTISNSNWIFQNADASLDVSKFSLFII